MRPRKRLQPRQRQAVLLLSEGLTYREIGDRIGISTSTVDTLVAGAYASLGVHNAAAAVGLLLATDDDAMMLRWRIERGRSLVNGSWSPTTFARPAVDVLASSGMPRPRAAVRAAEPRS